MSPFSLLPPPIAGNDALMRRLEDELGARQDGRGFFPTLRVRELCFRVRSESDAGGASALMLYEAASLMMLHALLEREELRLTWRPHAMIAIVARLVEETSPVQRQLLLLHLCVGLSPSEIAEVTGLVRVQEPLDRIVFQLSTRLKEGGFSLDRLHAGGIGPVGDVTRVLERVRAGEFNLAEALATDYAELLRIAEHHLGIGRTPGYDSASDMIGEAVIRLPVNPTQAPQNRKELRALVSKIVYHVVIDRSVRPASARASHQEADDTLTEPVDAEEVAIRTQMLDAVGLALDRIRREAGVAIVPATRSLQDRLFYALMNLRIEHARQFRVLLLKIEGEQTNGEIAALVGCSPASVKRDFGTAIQHLQNSLELTLSAPAG
jgi:DNA-directed RNA polymerase specialized sigma24 family protein